MVDESFEWGEVIADDDDYKVYKGYTYRGVEYSKLDSVYTFSKGARETDIGKITMIWETANKEKRVKLLWYFRPTDISNFLGDYRPAWNELFLASGNGKGLSNIIPLEAILGKCNVICTSKDRRNTPPSNSDLAKADYFFSHVFDVETRELSEKLPDTIASVKVERFLNQVIAKPKANLEGPRAGIPSSQQENQPLKRRKISDVNFACILQRKNGIVSVEEADMGDGTSYVKPQRPAAEENWLCKLPWEEKVVAAHERRRLVTLTNLDPSYTSFDVQEMILFAFKLTVDARIIPRRSSTSPLHAEALVVFNTMDEAKFVVTELDKKHLVDDNGRPVVAFKTKLPEPPKANYFRGHLKLEREKIRTSKEKAVSTSHCVQPGTIESYMGTEWILLHRRFELWYKAAHEKHAKETAACMKKLKSRQSSACTGVSVQTSKRAPEIQYVKEGGFCSIELKNSQSSGHIEASEATREPFM